MAISRSDVRKLTMQGVEAGAKVVRGVLTMGPDGVTVGQTRLEEEFARLEGQEVIIVVAAIGHNIAIESEVKTCYTCGRDYKGSACPHCAEARARLRG